MGQLRPPWTLGARAFPHDSPLTPQKRCLPDTVAFTSGLVPAQDKGRTLIYLMFPKCPLSSLIPKTQQAQPPVKKHPTHSKHQPKVQGPLRRLPPKDKGLRQQSSEEQTGPLLGPLGAPTRPSSFGAVGSHNNHVVGTSSTQVNLLVHQNISLSNTSL